jgi:hypothetical protein
MGWVTITLWVVWATPKWPRGANTEHLDARAISDVSVSVGAGYFDVTWSDAEDTERFRRNACHRPN